MLCCKDGCQPGVGHESAKEGSHPVCCVTVFASFPWPLPTFAAHAAPFPSLSVPCPAFPPILLFVCFSDFIYFVFSAYLAWPQLGGKGLPSV